ncbi:glycosyl hydrolase family 88, partial [Anaerotignum faecicola]|nr:glycosyl hydrolase family 88 [Anaerotignum faecicola]
MLAGLEQDCVWLEEARQKLIEKMEWVSRASAGKIPYTTVNGRHDDRSDNSADWDMGNGINWWTNGFWGGIQWLMVQATGDERYVTIARETEGKLDRCFELYEGLHHDTGFMWLPTAVADYRLTGDPLS